MKNMGGIKILFVTALALMILAGTGAAVSLSNSGGGTWKYQRELSNKENRDANEQGVERDRGIKGRKYE